MRAKQILDRDELKAFMPKGDNREISDLDHFERGWLEAIAARRANGGYSARTRKHNPDGPTEERLSLAAGGVSIGDDRQGTKVHHMMDTPLDSLYSSLVRASKTENQIERLRIEYAALKKYYGLFVESGMIGSISSVDPNRTYSPSPSGRTFLAGSERQQNIRDEYRGARIHLDNSEEYGHKQTIVLDNVICNEHSLEIAGYCVGAESKDEAEELAETILRDAGWRLGGMWGMHK